MNFSSPSSGDTVSQCETMNYECPPQNRGLLEFVRPEVFCFFSVLLAVASSRFCVSLCHGFYHCFLGQELGHNVDFKKYSGTWAVVTGASRGIGKAYAEQLAQAGINIVLISRGLSKLEKVAAGIKEKHNVETRTLALDFLSSDRSHHESILDLITELEVSVLVNNIGISFPYHEFIALLPGGRKLLDQTIEANLWTLTLMMRLILPKMVLRHDGVVINVSSFSSTYPLPTLEVHVGPSKNIKTLNPASARDYKQFGVTIQSVKCLFLSTRKSKIHRASWNDPTPEVYVRQALRTVGLEEATYGYLPHKIRGYVREVVFSGMRLACALVLFLGLLPGIRKHHCRRGHTEDPLLRLQRA